MSSDITVARNCLIVSVFFSGCCGVVVLERTCSEHSGCSPHGVVNQSSRGRTNFSSRGMFSGLIVKCDCLVVSVLFLVVVASRALGIYL
jgi:hypothetical protein